MEPPSSRIGTQVKNVTSDGTDSDLAKDKPDLTKLCELLEKSEAASQRRHQEALEHVERLAREGRERQERRDREERQHQDRNRRAQNRTSGRQALAGVLGGYGLTLLDRAWRESGGGKKSEPAPIDDETQTTTPNKDDRFESPDWHNPYQ